MSDKHSRRDFIVRSSSILALGLVAPAWLSRIAHGQIQAVASGASLPDENILIVCQLSGGNDGLNTVIPYTEKLYYSSRPEIAIGESQQVVLNDSLALHPSLAALKPFWDSGELAIVNGVGYPNPDRSHFRSMQIWQTADPTDTARYGWLGRYLDSIWDTRSSSLTALGIGNEKSEALIARRASVPVFASLEDVQSMLGNQDAQQALRRLQQINSTDPALAYASSSTQAALDSVAELKALLGNYSSNFSYEDNDFGNGFRQIAHLVAVSRGTRVIYLSVGGFDTHANQPDTHSNLLAQFGTAASTFMTEMKAIGAHRKITLLVFSEFGRRVSENGSKGTDHGAAAPVLLLGGSVRGGAYGSYPSLARLDDGDLIHSTDFRTVYGSVLRDWMKADAGRVLGGEFGYITMFS